MKNTFTPSDHQFMAKAIRLAERGIYTTSPNPRVGCVIVNHGQIVGEGFHEKAGQGHAEVHALAMAGTNAQGATAYVTLEPCSHVGRTPPCANALIDAGVSKVIAAMVDPNPHVSGRGLALLEQAGIETYSGLLEQDAKALNLGFINRMTLGFPYVRCKLAASLDGKTAMASGESQWITSKSARQDVQKLRAQSCAVITGADSVLVDNARMNVRWSELGDARLHYKEQAVRQPVRVVIDTKNRLTPDLAFFSEASPILLIRTSIENNHQWPHFVEEVILPKALNNEHVDLSALLNTLAKKEYNEVLIESGMTLAGAFIEQNLVDELVLYQAPKLMGHEGKGLLNMPFVQALSQAKTLTFSDITLVGADLKITAKFT
ncbi:bifunctional diaminohydroxyphosphoribosylaminopyrimidine deaminase/5-amino-6-(5-phosphoribosylamino)uracil reductase RibD [Thalassotalea castellviae]|uniref:Riboflavin biosynthesis protein RibD n=1 Tax=Thalassotalea castellviae TaxID=3075612 RepID=A0ABU2ZZU6_9GAMM|nr:bifunctional diaminohydroxyphosphoribosylaminopyrimidine deaminase/5-amino-6-(5-phosphoribosylamino)uracil reductase RibD [Thalassotalea sp. W431]MDT0603035.1 bifunctional diaminohydroxyphosphoribosylaminopyrimidine deaminase/5-amino-6-(5-phosphoribosylamino)uracil reductase RibD [Thalassotalea sp. W431]